GDVAPGGCLDAGLDAGVTLAYEAPLEALRREAPRLVVEHVLRADEREDGRVLRGRAHLDGRVEHGDGGRQLVLEELDDVLQLVLALGGPARVERRAPAGGTRQRC